MYMYYTSIIHVLSTYIHLQRTAPLSSNISIYIMFENGYSIIKYLDI